MFQMWAHRFWVSEAIYFLFGFCRLHASCCFFFILKMPLRFRDTRSSYIQTRCFTAGRQRFDKVRSSSATCVFFCVVNGETVFDGRVEGNGCRLRD